MCMCLCAHWCGLFDLFLTLFFFFFWPIVWSPFKQECLLYSFSIFYSFWTHDIYYLKHTILYEMSDSLNFFTEERIKLGSLYMTCAFSVVWPSANLQDPVMKPIQRKPPVWLMVFEFPSLMLLWRYLNRTLCRLATSSAGFLATFTLGDTWLPVL